MRRRIAWLLVCAALIAALIPVAAKTLCVGHECADEDCAYCATLRRLYSLNWLFLKPSPLAQSAPDGGARAERFAGARVIKVSPVALRVRLND